MRGFRVRVGPLHFASCRAVWLVEQVAERGMALGVRDGAVAGDVPLLVAFVCLGVFRLIAVLEDTFPLTIDESDMVPENFQSLNDIANFVTGKLG